MLPFSHRGLHFSRQADCFVGRGLSALLGSSAGIAARLSHLEAGAPGTTEPITPERAALLLCALGYHADVRTFRVDADVQMHTVAVYVNRGDPRIVWSRGEHQVPLQFHYRLNDRSHCDVTLFSGGGELDSGRFLAALTTKNAGQLLPEDREGMPRPEWDPFQLPDHEQREVKDMVRSVLSAFRSGPSMHAAAPSQPRPMTAQAHLGSHRPA